MCYEIVIFPIRKRHFRVYGWSGAFWEPLERKKDKTKCIYKMCILLHRSKLKIVGKFRDFAEISAKFCKILEKIAEILKIFANFAENLGSERCKRMQIL